MPARKTSAKVRLPYDHLQYAADVVAGKIVACKALKLACKRSLADHRKYAHRGQWVFREDFGIPVVRWIEVCPHVKGPKADEGARITLEPWQKWLVMEVYGWRFRSNQRLRRYTTVILEVAKKNGKSLLAAAIALYELRFGGAGAEVVSAATKRDQAKIVWEMAGLMLPRMPSALLGGARQTVTEIRYRGNTFKPLARKSHTLDGGNTSFFIVDEAAAIDDRTVVTSIESGMAARPGAWTLFITTAQSNTSTLYYERREYAMTVLRGEVEDEQIFAAIYELDEPDRKGLDSKPKVWGKANPNLGVSVIPEFLQKELRQSRDRPSDRNAVLIKNFNVWISSSAVWIPAEKWRRLADHEDNLKRKGPCWIGTDFALSRHLTAVCRGWARSREFYELDFQCWLPEAALEHVPKKFMPLYEDAIGSGVLNLTDGAITDYLDIENYLRQSCTDFEVEQIGADPWNATDMVNRLQDEGFPIVTVSQSLKTMSFVAKKTDALIENERFAHNGDPFITWQLENCHAYDKVNDNIKIGRGPDGAKMIDAIQALMVMVAVVDFSMDPEAGPGFAFVSADDVA